MKYKKSGLDLTTKEGRCEWQIRWNRAHPHSCKNTSLKYRYGITLEDYNNMLLKQEYSCAICHRPAAAKRGKSLFVDHCHKTKHVRGLLCLDCNTTLGRMNDDPKLLRKAAHYLECA
jgi:Recombination endonuclease VII